MGRSGGRGRTIGPQNPRPMTEKSALGKLGRYGAPLGELAPASIWAYFSPRSRRRYLAHHALSTLGSRLAVPHERNVWTRRMMLPRPSLRSRRLCWMEGMRRSERRAFGRAAREK